MTQYAPKPIDTSAVTLPSALEALSERLAASTHDQWALQRLKDGWVHGDKRDDDAKIHPSLIAYDDLSEAEKQYDRITSMETLKAIIALGFSIERG